MAKRVSLPGLAKALEDQEGTQDKFKRFIWSIVRTVSYTRSSVSNVVIIKAVKDPFNITYGWEGEVATATLDDDMLLTGYTIRADVPYRIGAALDKAWESLT